MDPVDEVLLDYLFQVWALRLYPTSKMDTTSRLLSRLRKVTIEADPHLYEHYFELLQLWPLLLVPSVTTLHTYGMMFDAVG